MSTRLVIDYQWWQKENKMAASYYKRTVCAFLFGEPYPPSPADDQNKQAVLDAVRNLRELGV